mgnify:FL=1
MTRYHGYVGYAIDVEAYPGVWEEQISEHEYFGDVLKNRINMQQGSVVNAKITISNSISIIADPFAFEHVYAMRYVTYLGKKWSIVNVSIERPRLILTLGGLYNE